MRHFLYYILLFFSAILSAQEVSFKAEVSRKSLGENERLRVDFIANQEGDNFKGPSFKDFEATGPIRSQYFAWINGNRVFTVTYTFNLLPKKKGKLTIGSASITIDGKEYKTHPITIEVTDPVANPRHAQTTPPTNLRGSNMDPFNFDPFNFDPFGRQDDTPTEVIEPTSEQLFIVAESSKKQVYVNEPVVATYKLYIDPRFGIAGYEKLDLPRFSNFWSQLLSDKFQTAEVSYNGKPYYCITLRQVLLYPQQAGELSMDPLSLSFILRLPTNKADMIGNRIYTTARKTLQSVPTKISVLPLPEEGKPANFSGAVGKFFLTVNFPTRQLNAGETSEGEVIISGKGNFKLFDMPKLSFPPALEVYAPKEIEHLDSTVSGISGDITHSYTIVPQYKGKFPIPSLNFNFFNPETQKYETLSSDNFTIEVLNGEEYKNSEDAIPSQQAKESFQPLKIEAHLSPIKQHAFFASTSFYLLWFLPLLLIPLVILFWHFYQKRNEDTQENRNRKSNRLAKKYLSAAKSNLNDKDAFYGALEKGLHTYLKAKLHIETKEFSKDKIETLLTDKKVNIPVVNNFIQLLSNCERARYSPYTQADIENDYHQAATIISLLDKQL